jgi:serine/threonine protein phosphatase PrpC
MSHIYFSANTDIGRKRSQNQDSVAAVPELGLFIVADGMGGHRGGETASAMAVELLPRYLKQELENDRSPRRALTQSLSSTNGDIYRRSANEPTLKGMGTTTTALFLDLNPQTKQKTAWVAHVGDSRCYWITPDGLWQATRDHSLVQEKIRAGLISREEAKKDQKRNYITRSVGFEPEVEIDIYETPVQEGLVFLICSDGLTGLVDDQKIHDLVKRHVFEGSDSPRSPAPRSSPSGSRSESMATPLQSPRVEQAASALIQQANQNGGDDNISVVLVHFGKASTSS